MNRWAPLLIALVLPAVASAGLRETLHNLSPGGAGRQEVGGGGAAMTESGDDLCIFCHTPHSAEGQRGLWNRALRPMTYKLYDSSTTEARLQQPTGSSRLCLSCHDGMIAIGTLKRHGDKNLGKLTGAAVLGTDLSDDHPISFVYDQALALRRRNLAAPSTLKGAVRLDETGQMQCTSCHDAHIEQHPKFLVIDPAYSALCVTCHRLPHWDESHHATSTADAKAIGSGSEYGTVGQNGCASCHRAHHAEHPERLLAATNEEEVCLVCHDGSVAAKNVRGEMVKYSAHRVDVYNNVHDPAENPKTMPDHVECVDCHNAHETGARSIEGQVPPALAGVSGVTVSGGFQPEASFEYEVCLKCHGIKEDRDPIVYRNDNVTNARLELSPQNASFHPVADVGRNSTILGLVSPLTAASRITCTDCHDNDAGARGSSAPRGPHGSNYRPILAAEYRVDAFPGMENYQLYALCYGCHERTTLLRRAGGFPHQLHVVDVGAGCADCHDAHGSRRDEHLINFMTRDLTGEVVVTASSSGRLEYDPLGMGAGRCYLTCHGSDHNPKEYSVGPRGGGAIIHVPGL